jgi:DNA-directed RNA polymerase subunit M/transcription elongation factor TFIIS
MHFCIHCSNMYYIRLSEEDPNSIVYYCRNCGHENKNITLDSVTISRTNFKGSKQKYNSIINKYTKMDPTLPRINTIKCPNQACKSNQEHEHAHAHAETPRSRAARAESSKSKASISAEAAAVVPSVAGVDVIPVEEQEGGAGGNTEREIIYLRYDDVNMNFVYLCPVCDSVWNTTQ